MLSKTHSKYIQSLHHKKLRDAENVFIAEGNKTVPELLAAENFECKEIVATHRMAATKQFVTATVFSCNGAGSAADMRWKKYQPWQQQVMCWPYLRRNLLKQSTLKGQISLVLDTIQDPGNLGTIIRIADWFGIKNIICSAGSADMYNPKVVQSTMGSLGRVNVLYTDIVSWLQENKNIKAYAAALNGKPLQQFQQLKEGLIVIGNESKGISDEVMQLCAEKITIPKVGAAESLNAAVASGIILSHIV